MARPMLIHSTYESLNVLDYLNYNESQTHSHTNKKINQILIDIMIDIMDNELTEIQHKYMTMYFFEGKDTPHIAKELGLNKSTVSRVIKKATATITKHLTYCRNALYKIEIN